MKYYSEKVKKLFDTVEALNAAEAELDIANAAKANYRAAITQHMEEAMACAVKAQQALDAYAELANDDEIEEAVEEILSITMKSFKTLGADFNFLRI